MNKTSHFLASLEDRLAEPRRGRSVSRRAHIPEHDVGFGSRHQSGTLHAAFDYALAVMNLDSGRVDVLTLQYCSSWVSASFVGPATAVPIELRCREEAARDVGCSVGGSSALRVHKVGPDTRRRAFLRPIGASVLCQLVGGTGGFSHGRHGQRRRGDDRGCAGRIAL